MSVEVGCGVTSSWCGAAMSVKSRGVYSIALAKFSLMVACNFWPLKPMYQSG